MLKNCKDWANIRIEIRLRFGFFLWRHKIQQVSDEAILENI